MSVFTLQYTMKAGKSILTFIIVLFVALQVINLSIDSVLFEPTYTNNSIGEFNYFNSFTEFISEEVLNHRNAFPEYSSAHNTNKSQSHKHSGLKLFYTTIQLQVPVVFATPKSSMITYNDILISTFSPDVIPHPPNC